MGIDEILHIEAFGVWFFLIGSGSNYKQDGILPYAEPYLPAQRPFQFPTGWNSTNQGITSEAAQKWVSIPNGMEFYQIAQNLAVLPPSFNSQRDGLCISQAV